MFSKSAPSIELRSWRALLTDETDAVLGLALLCIAGSVAVRLAFGIGQPLWLDEAWTGAIIAQPDVTHLFEQIYLDSNAPLYFVLMFGWSKLFGLSDFALRLPSLLFGLAAPCLILATKLPGLPRNARLTWAVLLGLWFPGLWYSQDARCYALLLFLCTGQTLAFARVIAQPRLRIACGWVAWSSLAVLTHYHAGFVTACEGIAYLALWRMRAMRTWPAALGFTPAILWLLYHLPRLADFLRPGVAWYNRLALGDLVYIVEFLVGTPFVPVGFALAILGVVAVRRKAGQTNIDFAEAPARLWIVVLAALCAATIAVTIGALRPTFAFRYLVPVVPGLTLGFALATQVLARRWATCHAVVMLACLCGCVLAANETSKRARSYSFEAASNDFARQGVRELVFTLDNPTSAALTDAQLAALGGFFFRREGRPVSVVPIKLIDSTAPSEALVAAARSPHAAILWLYDLNVHDTVARRLPPHIDKLDPAWRCRDYGSGAIGVLGCTRTE